MSKYTNIGNLRCLSSMPVRTDRVAYILYPMDILSDWIDVAAKRFSTTIVVITGMDWQNVFSPWPAPGVPKGTPDFKGESASFLHKLSEEVIPVMESDLGLRADVERTLVGVSMSGLFALWQWAECDLFANVASLSGSFWYEGFTEWFAERDFRGKKGRAYFLLGDRESQARSFSSVAVNTSRIIADLRNQGVEVTFESVPGDHYADPIPRLNKAFAALS